METDESAGYGDSCGEISLLYVDEETRQEAVAAYADEHHPAVTLSGVSTADEAVTAVSEGDIDAVVADCSLPDGTGIDLYERLSENGYDGAFVLVSDRPARVARKAFTSGIDDIVKRSRGDNYGFLLDKVFAAVGDEPDGASNPVGGVPVDEDTMIAVVDEDGDAIWRDGSLPGMPDVDAEHVHEAVSEILESDEVFREQMADGDQRLTDPHHWALADDGALEQQRYALPDTIAGAYLERFRDVSHEYELRDRLDRFERLLSAASDGLYALDPNGYYTYVNDAMAEILGYERDEMLGMHAAEILDEYGRGQEHVQDLVADTERESEVLEMTVHRADGSTLPVAISYKPLYNEEGGYEGLVGVMRDITERKVREDKLRESERRYRALAENMPQGGVAMFDDELRYTLVAGEIFEQIGPDPADLEGRSIDEVHTDSFLTQLRPAFEAIFDDERQTVEFEYGGRYFRSHLVPLEDADDEVTAGLALAVDITDRRTYEQKLEQQNQRLEEFASIVSHDLRNPLNVIEGRLELYRDDGDETHLDSVEESVDDMRRLIDDLLKLARQGKTVGGVEPTDLDALVTTAWENVGTDEVSLHCDDDLGDVLADADRLKQLLENLFRNAVEHGSTAGTVRVGRLSDGFFVADDGPGIPESVADNLFEYGTTTAEDGTGIGLAIVAEIVEAHGWEIEASESESGGARFEITGVERP